MAALKPSKEKPSLCIVARTVKYRPIFNLEQKGKKFEFYIWFTSEVRTEKNILWKWCLLEKKFLFFNEKLRRK